MDMFLQRLIVYAYQRIKDQRSMRSFYFILKGKRSLQAIQDAQLFGLEKFYYTLPELNYDVYQQCFETAGSTKLDVLVIEDTWYHQHLYTYEVNRKSIYFIERLQLLIQVLSHLKRKDKHYMPMCRRYETQKYVKQLLKQAALHSQFPNIYQALFDEYYDLLIQVPEMNREIMLGKQLGDGFYGETVYQISERLHLTQTETQINECATMQFMFQQVRAMPERYPILSKLLPAVDAVMGCTASARKTKEWLDRGKTIDEICALRHMKRGTIESHIIEIAMQNQEFSIEPYLSLDKMKRIIACVEEMGNFRLRNLKETLGDDFSYFEIRLGLTKVEEERCY